MRRLGALASAVVVLAGACTPVAPSAAPTALVAAPSAASPSVPAEALPSPSPAFGGAVTARYTDGLPSRMGETPVFRGQAAVDHAAAQPDDAPFLVAGWVTYLGPPVSCVLYLGPVASWKNPCGPRARFSDVAGEVDPDLSGHLTFRFVLDGPLLGPVAVVAHVHDPRATQCESEQALCDRMMVVDRIAWNGDAATEPSPVTRSALVEAILAVQGTAPVPFGADTTNPGCGLPGLYLYAVETPDDATPMVTCVALAPTIEARKRGLDRPDGVAAALRPKAVAMESRSYLHNVLIAHVTYRWLVVENVALMVRTQADPTNRDRRFLEDLVAALER